MELVDYQYLEQVSFSKWTFLSVSLVRQTQQKLRKHREQVITLHPPSFYKIKHTTINYDAKKNSLQDVIIRKSIPLFLRSSKDSIWCWLPPSPHSVNLQILSSSQNGRICSPGGVFSPYPHRYSRPTEQPTPLRHTTAHTSQLLVKELIRLINQINLWQQSPTWRDASHLTHLVF